MPELNLNTLTSYDKVPSPNKRLLQLVLITFPILAILGGFGVVMSLSTGIQNAVAISKMVQTYEQLGYTLEPQFYIWYFVVVFAAFAVSVLSLIAAWIIHRKKVRQRYEHHYKNVYQGQVDGHRAHLSNLQLLICGRTLQNQVVTRWMTVSHKQYVATQVGDYIELGRPEEV